jgi:MOSC domain-containing protein YiiM
MQTSVRIASLFAGPVRPLERPGHAPVPSGIAKDAQRGPLRLTVHGFEGDEQGDKVYHGGPEKAVHHYASEHYARWGTHWPDSLVPLAPGAFGENFATSRMSEREVCIGDIVRAGSALLQVSQGRQPCWRLNRRIGRMDAALAMQRSGATGWYYRVLEEGVVAPGDGIGLVARPHPGWPLARLMGALFPLDPAAPGLRREWEAAAALAALTASWKATFARRLETGRIEDWSRRLDEA